MSYLLDTGVLLRVADVKDAQHAAVANAVRTLVGRRENLVITTQNVAEFCNVATRPTADNGLGKTPTEALALLKNEVESICAVIYEQSGIHAELKRLLATYNVSGKKVHDARLVAIMIVSQVGNILTLNDADFRRYEPEGITVVTPASLAASP
jgi:predicted nucleic acid-binding protein